MVTARELVELPPELERAVSALDPSASLSVRLDAIEDLARWVIYPGGFARLRAPAPLQLSRLKHFIQVLEDHPDVAAKLSTTLGSVFAETTSVALFAESGMPGDRGFVGETFERLAQRLLPQPADDENLERFVSRLFRAKRDCAWIDEAPPELFARLAALFGTIWAPVVDGMKDAVALLCTRVSALGLSAPLRERSEAMIVRDSPFFRLPLVSIEEMPLVIIECRRQLEIIRKNLETSGVSVDVVFRVDSIERMLRRVARLVTVLDPNPDPLARAGVIRGLLSVLTIGRIADRSIRQLGKENLGLVAKKMIERVSHSGEHYIASTRKEYFRMLVSAAGGGVLATFTVIGMFFIRWGHFAPFIDGLGTGCVYAGSFLAMQLVGLTLANKQSSMTAAALASTLHDGQTKQQLDNTIGMIARMCRAQFAAAFGNMVAIIPVAIGLDLLWVLVTGDHFLDRRSATAAIDSLDPIRTGTIPFAAITGVLLFLSSLAAGWLDNWMMYRRLPDAIRQHRGVGRFAGSKSLERIASFLERHTAGIGGSVTLGFLLALTPTFFKLFGIPIDIRHITLSTGSLVFSGCTLGFGKITISACIGIFLIGILNFTVSFALALWVALRARDIGNKARLEIAVGVVRRFTRHPLEFVWPTKASLTEPPIPVAQLE
ncbi:MAG TPA: hypothetical protein VGC41_19910 [Kofleriaceae bacterium]